MFFIIIIFYLIFKNKNLEKTTNTDDIREQIKQVYQADVQAIKNLGDIANKMITEDGTLTLPYNVNITGDLTIEGNSEIKGQTTIHEIKGGKSSWKSWREIQVNGGHLAFNVGGKRYGFHSNGRMYYFEPNSEGAVGYSTLFINNDLKLGGGLNVGSNLNVGGRAHIQNATDVGLTNTNAPLVIGPKTGTHIEIDGNEIMAKSDATTASGLYLNNEGGLVQTGGDLNVVGNGIIGNAYIGKLGTTNNTYATFCHKNQKSADKKYSICQNSSGATWLNSSGTINVRKNDTTSGARLLIYGNIVLNNKVDIYENGSGDRNPRIVFEGNNLNVQMYYEPENKNNYLRVARNNNTSDPWWSR